jgi:hybrid polyketide synthase / nonribosomal peptide synthetase ACE1
MQGKYIPRISVRNITNPFPSDVTNREDLNSLVHRIEQELPPIAGVANGAMVLEDTPVTGINAEKFEKVLKPKVLGSVNLDNIFGDRELEFFILFSSVAAVVGNKGQAAYSAANAFMSSLANDRRRRGLVASVIHIGAVVGTGYLTREVSYNVQDYLHKAGYMWMSESEFHQVFAEGVLAGPPTTGQSHEIMSGLRIGTAGEENYVWYQNPIFQHCITSQRESPVHNHNPKEKRSLKVQLEDSFGLEQRREIISGKQYDSVPRLLRHENISRISF